jgi:drug/metabolite transporter (DMT)-like permease
MDDEIIASYCLQNLLAFVALQRLDAATFSVVNQMKILTSALFARLVYSPCWLPTMVDRVG